MALALLYVGVSQLSLTLVLMQTRSYWAVSPSLSCVEKFAGFSTDWCSLENIYSKITTTTKPEGSGFPVDCSSAIFYFPQWQCSPARQTMWDSLLRHSQEMTSIFVGT